MRLALFLLLAAPLAAQPSADVLVDAWLADWRRAGAGAERVTAVEDAVWTVDGPRGRVEVEAASRVVWGGAHPERDVERLVVDGERVDADRAGRTGERWDRAFGAAGREVHALPDLPGRILSRARARGTVHADRLDGYRAWRVSFGDEGTAWFTRSTTSPRLLAIRVEGERSGGDRHGGRDGRPRRGPPPQARFTREVLYTRVDGLDVPVSVDTRVTVRQQRRMREYFVTLTATADYSRHVVR